MSNSSITKNDSPDISANSNNNNNDVQIINTPLQASTNLGSMVVNSNSNIINNRMYMNSNSCLNSLESAQLKKLKKSLYSLNQQQDQDVQHLEHTNNINTTTNNNGFSSPSKQLTENLLKLAKPDRVSPPFLSSSPMIQSLLLTSNASTPTTSTSTKQEYDSNSNSNSPHLSSSSSSSSSSNGSVVNFGDQRTMDAADTLVSLSHSASSTPTIESKSFADAIGPCSTTTTNTNSVGQHSIDINNNIEIVSVFLFMFWFYVL
jgi:hypothetical protein